MSRADLLKICVFPPSVGALANCPARTSLKLWDKSAAAVWGIQRALRSRRLGRDVVCCA